MYPQTTIIYGFEVPAELQDAVSDLYEILEAAGYSYDKEGWETSSGLMAVGVNFGEVIDLPAMNAISVTDLANLIVLLNKEIPEFVIPEPNWYVISSVI